MNDKQVAAFLSVAECGSFSRAARRQYISPQAMIQQIDLLEKEVGVRLLHRTHRGVTLTDAGVQFYQGMLRISSDVRALLEQIRSAESCRLRIGVFDMSQMMARVCESFSALHPEIAQEYIMISPEAWMDELQQLHAGQLDILEHTDVPQVHENGLDFVPVMQDEIICALHAAHPLAKKDMIFPEDLAHLRIGIHDVACVPGLQPLLSDRAPGSELIDGNKGPLSAFDICKSGGVFLSSKSFSVKYRPLRVLPFRCDLAWTYGLVFKKDPRPLVQLFIENARAQFKQE